MEMHSWRTGMLRWERGPLVTVLYPGYSKRKNVLGKKSPSRSKTLHHGRRVFINDNTVQNFFNGC